MCEEPVEEFAFVDLHAARLADLTRMSRTAGSRSDYVQGGGGNTSCKLDHRLMAIKASGFRLDQIAPDQAYAVLDYADVRAFYRQNDPAALADVEQAGSAAAKAATLTIPGLPVLRPSVEAGFHSLLDTFVLHTHAIYANLLTCAAEGPALAAKIMGDRQEPYAFVPYINPGAQLTFAIDAACQQAAAVAGKQPAVIFMQNHGVIVTGPDADACLQLHDRVNEQVAAAFGVSARDWPAVTVKPALRCVGDDTSSAWQSATPWLQERLLDTLWDLDFFTTQALYPDQLVFLAGQLAVAATGSVADFTLAGDATRAKATLFRETGEILYLCSQNEAQTIEETLCAILFITRAVRAAGYTVCTMNEAGKDFISNWESEKYRKSITAK